MTEQSDSTHGLSDRCDNTRWRVARRDFLKASGLVIAGLSVAGSGVRAAEPDSKTMLRFGIVTDPHYTDVARRGSRYYKESLAKMAECVALMNKEKADFLIELGDFKDQAAPPKEKTTLASLRTIEQTFGKFSGSRYHVLGNHDVDSISKEQFQAIVTNTGIPRKSTYYSFDLKGVHFVVLDANYRTDGVAYKSGNYKWTDANIPPAEMKWVEGDLASTSKPTVVFVHQQLDGKGSHYIKNAPAVREALQKHTNVLAVFQGHNHAGHYSHIEGIHYYTLNAMVEGTGLKNSSYAIVDVHKNHDITVTGYRKAPAKKLANA